MSRSAWLLCRALVGVNRLVLLQCRRCSPELADEVFGIKMVTPQMSECTGAERQRGQRLSR